MECRLLGPLQVLAANRELALGGAKQRALFAILSLRANQVVSTDRLAEDLWAAARPQSAENVIQVYVSRLRKCIGATRIVTRAPGYLLVLEPDEIDVAHFERLAEQGRRAFRGRDYDAAAEALRDALNVWRGGALADLAYEPFAQAEILRLEEARLAVLEDRIEADLALGRHAELVGELEALIAQNPLRERLRGQLMLALYRARRQAEALAVYRRTRKTLVSELGLEPGPALQRLATAILRQEPFLEPPERRHDESAGSRHDEIPGSRPARKPVTVVSIALDVSTSLDIELVRAVVDRASRHIAAPLKRHGASVDVRPSEGIRAIFGMPFVREDDARRAVRGALEACYAAGVAVDRGDAAALERVQLRIGVDTGEVLVSSDGSLAGRPVVNALRLRELANPGEIVIGDCTRLLVGESLRLGERRASDGWHVVAMNTSQSVSSRPISHFVGRHAEVRQLAEELDRVVADRSCRIVCVHGEAGIGKSRLCSEFAAGQGIASTSLRWALPTVR